MSLHYNCIFILDIDANDSCSIIMLFSISHFHSSTDVLQKLNHGTLLSKTIMISR